MIRKLWYSPSRDQLCYSLFDKYLVINVRGKIVYMHTWDDLIFIANLPEL